MVMKDGPDAWTRTMLQRAEDATSFDTEQFRRCRDDMRFAFVAGHQWDAHLTRKRRNRPCYEFNRLRQLIRRVTGQQLQNKPDIKVRPSKDGTSEVAEVLNGLIRNIEVDSHAETAYDTAFNWACGGGYGVLRVVAEYESEDSFDQVLKIKTVYDPMTVRWDPGCKELDNRDARYCFVYDVISKEEFKTRWPDAEMADIDVDPGISSIQRDWYYEDTVRIAEYWYKKPATKTIYQLSDGTVVDAEEFDPIADEAANPPVDPQTGQPEFPPLTIKSQRDVDYDEVWSVLVSGMGQLEKPSQWGGSRIPIVPQWGDIITIDGKRIFSGMTRFSRDSQTIHNFEMSAMVEVIAKMPNSALMATPKMIEGLKSYYERLGYDDPPVLLYNPDDQAPGLRPERQPLSGLPPGMAQLAAMASDEMKATAGVYDASIGAQSNETSGRAILARNAQGDTANFVYIDNQMKAMKSIGEILVDAIPHYYDATRQIRILGADMQEKVVDVNRPMIDQQTGEEFIINDLSRGNYDVTVTVGKSFDTQRLEVADAAQALASSPGPVGALAQYLLIKNLDVPGMDEFTDAVRTILVKQGLLPPGPNDQPPAPPQPNPKDVADAQKNQALAQKYNAEAGRAVADTHQKQIETALMVPQAEADLHKTHAQTVDAATGTVAQYHDMITKLPNWLQNAQNPVDTTTYSPQ
jgi:hypothetical protein